VFWVFSLALRLMKRPLSLVLSHGFRRNSRRPVSLVVGVATALLAGIALVIASPLAPASPVSANGGCAEEAIPEDGGVFQVSTPGQLLSLANTSNTASLSAIYEQIEHIDLSSCGNWPGIGDTNHPFTGSYNGGGHTISNVTISVSTSDRGFFNRTNGSTISALTLAPVTVSDVGFSRVGSLIGLATDSSVASVTVAALTATGGGSEIGGLIGELDMTAGRSAHFAAISVTGEINSSGRRSNYGGLIGLIDLEPNAVAELTFENVVTNVAIGSEIASVGGLVGKIDPSSAIARIHFTNVSASGSISTTRPAAGGLVGTLNVRGDIVIASAETNISITSTDSQAGGLIGSLDAAGYSATISSAVAYGDVTGSSQVGGLIGELRLGIGSSARISDVEAHGAVSATGSSDRFGGLIGSVGKFQDSQGVISGSTASGNVVSGGGRGGGLVGEISGPGGSFQIESSSASGSITGSTNVGGLVGLIRHGGELRIADSYASGNVTSSAQDSSVGGLIGNQAQATDLDGNVLDGETTIARTYSTGSVTGNGNVGGLIGLTADATVCASFWDLNTSGQATSAGGSGAVGKSTTDMKKLSTFSGAGWSIGSGSGDSSKIWGITENTSYPVLIWPTQGVSGDCEQSGSGSGNGGGVTSPGESGVESTVPPTTVPPTSQVPVPVSVGGVLPALAAGEVVVYEDGVPVVVEVFVDDDTELVVLASTFELRLSGECSEGCAITTNDDGRETLILEQEGLANVTGVGFEPGSSVYVWLFSEPRFLGELTVNADGTFAGSVALGDVEIGEHTLQVNGVSQQGSQRSANLGVVVDPEGVVDAVLPSTGGDQNLMVWLLTVLLLVLGVGLTRVARRPVVVR
jgi:hypothetical protein